MGIKFNPLTGQFDLAGGGGGGFANPATGDLDMNYNDITNVMSIGISEWGASIGDASSEGIEMASGNGTSTVLISNTNVGIYEGTSNSYVEVSPDGVIVNTDTGDTEITTTVGSINLVSADEINTTSANSTSIISTTGNASIASRGGTTGLVATSSGATTLVSANTQDINLISAGNISLTSANSVIMTDVGDVDINSSPINNIAYMDGSDVELETSSSIYIHSPTDTYYFYGDSTGPSMSGTAAGVTIVNSTNRTLIEGAGGVRIPVIASTPGSLENGLIWYNSGDNSLYSRINGATEVITTKNYVDNRSINSSTTIVYNSGTYANVQAAVDAAELLAAADPSNFGMVVIELPAGYFNETVTIRKNVGLVGKGRMATRINTLNYRPVDATANNHPQYSILNDLQIATLSITPEYSPGNFSTSPLFNNAEIGAFTIDDCFIPSGTIQNIGGFVIQNSEIGGLTATNVTSGQMYGCLINTLTLTSDDTFHSFVGGTSVYFDICSITSSATVTKTAGTSTATLNTYNTFISALVANANTEININGGYVGSRTLNGTGHIISAYSTYAPFTPAVSGDWTTQPTNIQDALDQLAARLNVLEP